MKGLKINPDYDYNFVPTQVAIINEGVAKLEAMLSEQDVEIAQLREKLAAAEEKRDMWLRIAQRLFKERQTMLHGHVYDLPTDDVILEATILEAIIARAFGIDRDRSKRKK